MQKNTDWVRNQLSRSTLLKYDDAENDLIQLILKSIYSSQISDKNLLLAAGFDLLVGARYYGSVAHKTWLYCPNPDSDPTLYYQFNNKICPRCVLDNEFHYHKNAAKPASGNIGQITQYLMAIYLQNIFDFQGMHIEVRQGIEPVDLILVDDSSMPSTIFFAEVKSAPLSILPIAMPTDLLTQQRDEDTSEIYNHSPVTNTNFYNVDLNIGLPIQNSTWSMKFYPLGSKKNKDDVLWAFRGLSELLRSDSKFFDNYFKYWKNSFISYANKSRESIYWLTGACGKPYGNFSTISDSKTSVGMDRTDDLKKAVYQVIKIRTKVDKVSEYDCKVGILSNIHAIRHFDVYIRPLKDIIWFIDKDNKIQSVNNIQPDTKLYNLFDGIVTFTETHARDRWVQTNLTF